jgi:hypothetical protein
VLGRSVRKRIKSLVRLQAELRAAMRNCNRELRLKRASEAWAQLPTTQKAWPMNGLIETGSHSRHGGETMRENSPESKEKPSTTLRGTVEKIIKPIIQHESEKAQIGIHGAEALYREIRIENTLTNEQGEEVAIKEGAKIDVTIEADSKDTTKKAK